MPLLCGPVAAGGAAAGGDVGSLGAVEASPSGLVTFLLTDVEGSTGLWERDEPGMDDALARDDNVMRGVIAAHGGHVFSTAGDSFAVAFATPMAAVNAAVDDPKSETYDARDAVRAATATATVNPHQLAFAYLGLLIDAVGRGNRQQAVAAFGQAKALGDAATNRMVIAAAPLFLAMTSADDDPREALSLTSEMLTAAYDAGYWANLDFALRRIVLPLLCLDRARPAAVVLGGLTGLDDATPDTQNVIPRATALLTDSLGDEYAPLFDQGRSYSKHDLVRFALDEIDAAIASA